MRQHLCVSQRLPPHCRQESVTPSLLAQHPDMHSAAQPSRIHKLVAVCLINACLLSAFCCLDVDYSDEHCHLVSSVITLLSGRFNTELHLYLCNLSNLFMTDFTRL